MNHAGDAAEQVVRMTQNFAGLAALPPSPAQNIFAGRRKNV